MVGVPGRSKACNTCKKRKIACGAERPQCKQCVKSKLICSGYQKERIFIVNEGSQENKQYTARAPAAEATSSAKHPSLVKTWKNGSNDVQQRDLSLIGPLSSQVACRQQLFSAFILSFVPDQLYTKCNDRHWITTLADIPSQTKALEKSTLAISVAYLGRLNSDEVLLKEGLSLYTQGLWELRNALLNPELVYRDETLAACMLLMMYELFECPAKDKAGYIHHHDGCSKLIQMRGPKAHMSGLGHRIFLSFRLQGILRGMDTSTPTFLSEPGWSSIPWSKFPDKSLYDKLVDTLSIAPTILSKAEELKVLDPSDVLMTILEMTDDCWALDARLSKFYKELEDSHLGPLYWPEFSQHSRVEDDSDDKLFVVAFQFPNLKMAATLMMFWAIQTMLWSGMVNLYEALANEEMALAMTALGIPNPLDRLAPLEHREDVVVIGRNVCQSVEYCMQDEMLGFGPMIAPAPLNIVVETLKHRPDFAREVVWVQKMLAEISQRGLRIVRYMTRDPL